MQKSVLLLESATLVWPSGRQIPSKRFRLLVAADVTGYTTEGYFGIRSGCVEKRHGPLLRLGPWLRKVSRHRRRANSYGRYRKEAFCWSRQGRHDHAYLA